VGDGKVIIISITVSGISLLHSCLHPLLRHINMLIIIMISKDVNLDKSNANTRVAALR